MPGSGGTAARSRESIRPTTRIAFGCGGAKSSGSNERASPFALESKSPGCIRGFCAFGPGRDEHALTGETPQASNAFLDARLIKIQRLPWYLRVRGAIFWQQQTSLATYIAPALWQRKAATVSPQRHAIQIAYLIQHVRHYKWRISIGPPGSGRTSIRRNLQCVPRVY